MKALSIIKTTIFLLLIPTSRAFEDSFKNEILGKVTQLEKTINGSNLEKVKIDRHLFLIERNLDHEMALIKQNGKFYSESGIKKLLTRSTEMNAWSVESIETLSKIKEEVSDQITKIEESQAFKSAILAKDEFLRLTQNSEADQTRERLRGFQDLNKSALDLALIKSTEQLSQLLEQKEDLDQAQEAFNKIKDLRWKIDENNDLLTQVCRRLRINSKSIVLKEKIDLIGHDKELLKEKIKKLELSVKNKAITSSNLLNLIEENRTEQEKLRDKIEKLKSITKPEKSTNLTQIPLIISKELFNILNEAVARLELAKVFSTQTAQILARLEMASIKSAKIKYFCNHGVLND